MQPAPLRVRRRTGWDRWPPHPLRSASREPAPDAGDRGFRRAGAVVSIALCAAGVLCPETFHGLNATLYFRL
jgi:hypothetical protein